MAKGQIEQLDLPEEIYNNPRTVFAASFVGTSNHFRGVLESASEGLCQVENQTLHVLPVQNLHDGDRVLVMVRPEEVSIQSANEGADYSANGVGNHIAGVIELRTFLGPFTRFHVRVNESTTLTADVPSQQARDYYVAQHVVLSFSPNACQVLSLDKDAAELARLAEAEKV
ncbi:MAG TPA: hypothetical protein DCS90_06825 [Ktedonobacter sp.]|nr:hypothetical protein [Ktedonobacter sp.]